MSTTMLGGLNQKVATRLEGVSAVLTEKLKRFFPRERDGESCPVCSPFRETHEIAIDIPALPRPTLKELQARYPWIEKIERDTSPTGPVTLVLGTVIGEDEGETAAVTGPEYDRRLASKRANLLGLQHHEWLIEHQAELPTLMAIRRKIHIDFPGLVVLHRRGVQQVPFAYQDDNHWCSNWYWLEFNPFFSNARVAVSRR